MIFGEKSSLSLKAENETSKKNKFPQNTKHIIMSKTQKLKDIETLDYK
jgi:hypothetical protein